MYRVIGRKNVPKGDDGIDTHREWVVRSFDYEDDLDCFITGMSVDAGEMGGSSAHIVTNGSYTPLRLHEHNNETKVTKLKILSEYLANKVSD